MGEDVIWNLFTTLNRPYPPFYAVSPYCSDTFNSSPILSRLERVQILQSLIAMLNVFLLLFPLHTCSYTFIIVLPEIQADEMMRRYPWSTCSQGFEFRILSRFLVQDFCCSSFQ